MESINPKDLFSLISNPAFLLAIIWLGKEIYYGSQKKALAYNAALKDNADKLTQLTIVLTKVETQLEAIQKACEAIPKMREDISAAHSKLRELTASAGHA